MFQMRQPKKSKTQEEEEVCFELDWEGFRQRSAQSRPLSTMNSLRKGSTPACATEDENVLSDDDIIVETDGDASIRRDYLENELYGHSGSNVSSKYDTLAQSNSDRKASHAHTTMLTR